jgi:hypothetical protein
MIMTNTNPAQTTSSEMSPWPDSAMTTTKKKKNFFAALYPVVDPVILELMLVYRLCQLLAQRTLAARSSE